MTKDEIAAFLEGNLRQHELVIKRVWELRLNRRLGDAASSNAPGRNQRDMDCFAIETEQRLADTKRLILLYIPRIPDGDDDIAQAAVEVFEHRAVVIADEIVAIYSDYLSARNIANLTLSYSTYVNGKHAAAVIWDILAIREDVYRTLAERAQMKAVLESAKASTAAAEAEQRSAEASVIAAEASKRAADLSAASVVVARKTETWTKWAAIATAVAAGGTLLAAITTAWTTWHVPKSQPLTQSSQPNRTITQSPATAQATKTRP